MIGPKAILQKSGSTVNNNNENNNASKAEVDITENKVEKVTLIQRLWRLRNFFRKMDFKDPSYLKKVAIRVAKTEVPLTANPLVPTAQTIDKAKAEKFIAQFASPNMRATARKIIEKHLKHISFEEFERRLHDVMFKFNQYLLAKNVAPCSVSVVIEPDHSSEWVASLAVKYLNFIPENYYTIDCQDMMRMSERFKFSKIRDKEHTLVIFDDWSISGTQLSEILNNIKIAKEKSIQPFKLNIVVVTPLMTHHAYQTNLERFKKADFSLRIITAPFMPSIKALQFALTKSEFGDFNEMIGLDRDAHTKFHPPEYAKQVMAFSDWKVPDYVSMPNEFSTGKISWSLTPYVGKRFDEVPKEANNNKFIPDVTSPYHKKTRW